MTTRSLADRIADGRVHVVDGAMGTMLYGRGVFVHVCYDELNLTQPDLVREIHEGYVAAGADILETNTFGANPVKLSSFGFDGQTEALNTAAARLARQAAGDRVSVVGALGPLGIRIEPFGPTGRDEAEALFGRQVDGLLAGDVDGFILETFADVEELAAALRAVRARCALPVIAQMTIGETGITAYGTDVETVARRLTELEPEVLGLNCAVGPAAMLDAIERMAAVTAIPLSAQPNAGVPREVGDRKIYLASPEYMARYSRRFIEAGARFVGGCCGTTPEHIRRIRDQVATVQPRRSRAVFARAEVQAPTGIEPVPLAHRSRWGAALAGGAFAVSVETLPPRGWQADDLIRVARDLQAVGVDALSLLDTPRAEGRMGVLPTAMLVQRDTGLETVVHYTCRDRNMLGMLADLLGAAAMGLRNLLLVTGDAPTMGPYPDSTAVFDIDSIGLTNVAYRLNHGLDPGSNPIGPPTRFVIGVAANHAATDLEREVGRFFWKVDAGAEFAITQPVFDAQPLAAFLERVREFRIPVLASLWPLISARNAEFLANEVPGVHVPQAVLDRMRAAQSRGPDAAAAEGLAIARELLETIRPMVQGVQIVAPFGEFAPALALAKEAVG
ncbi:MAG: bifunctional homocysteine S-methyltransferase/methylenetetrahydrofolate reductase [Gemmatimonadota bacterium]|nr:bifunctional homocysteine S-methyltransferase/methylenetetrahydrofolate reductase [Gemmatimonadota bacterium]MDH5195728.1 bifunctional homocysteine S-methyltransferase/methylenetetrahydrofolate reductase [Gemmatimonadota bacterium]